MGQRETLRLEVEKHDSVLVAHWAEMGGKRGERFELVLPLVDEDNARLRWYLEKYRGFVGAGTRVKAQAVEGSLEVWGRQLFDSCFTGPQSARARQALESAKTAGTALTLTLASEESLFHQQPWELIRDQDGPLVFQGVSLRRQLVSEVNRRPCLQAKPLRLLLIVARPDDAGFIDPRSSQGPLLDALEQLPAGAVELDLCQPPTLSRLEEMLEEARAEDRPFHVVHFDGHGTYLPVTGEGVVAFEKNDRTMERVVGRRFGELLANLQVPLVILEACRTASLSDMPVHGSVAPALLGAGVGSVLAFSHNVSIDASRILVERFYRELVLGRSIAEALAAARSELRIQPQRRLHVGPEAATIDFQDWFLPQLYQSGVDQMLLAETAVTAPAPKPAIEERLYKFPPQPMYLFQGRARDLLEMERAFEQHPALLLSGGGGMGKTALAREAAWWWLRTGRFERAVFVSFEQVTTVERVIQELGQAFAGLSFSSRPAGDQREVALRLFRERAVLLVWDNFESTLPQFQQGDADGMVAYPEEQRAPLRRLYLELTACLGGGRLLVTCRSAEATLPGIRCRTLAGLARQDSLSLVQAIAQVRSIDLQRKGFERENVEELLELLQDHPLSISLVAPHLKVIEPTVICSDFADLLGKFYDGTAEGKNRSLLASLAYSTSRLSPSARTVLPFLAWFQTGVLEPLLLDFAMLTPESWLSIRGELEATALIRVEKNPAFMGQFLRFHPTLAYAARRQEVGDVGKAESRFVELYLGVRHEIDAAFRNRASASIALLEHEEANFRLALDLAFRGGRHEVAAALADTLGRYLAMAARFAARDQLVDWVQSRMPRTAGLDSSMCAILRKQASSLADRGRAVEATERVRHLISRLESGGLAKANDTSFELGTSLGTMGQIWLKVGRPDLALVPLTRAIDLLEQLPEDLARANLSSALGDLGSSYRALGNTSEALQAAERSLGISRQLGSAQEVAIGLSRCAGILVDQQRWVEAEQRYQEALALARGLDNLEHQSILIQNLGTLHRQRGDSERAVKFYEEAILFFQRTGDIAKEMRTLDLLASAETQRSQFEMAEAWFLRSRELATQLEDSGHLAIIAHNMGILFQIRSEKAQGSEERLAWLHRAVDSFEESLAIKRERNNWRGAANSSSNLGSIYRLLGNLGKAEAASREAAGIRGELNDPAVVHDYDNLAKLAAERGDSPAAAQWSAKREAKLAELRPLPDLDQLAEPLLTLSRSIYTSLASRSELEPWAARAVVTLVGQTSPLAEIGNFLRSVAANEMPPPLPSDLLPRLQEICEGLAKAVAKLPK
jgi:tetratricopeptide (TPR) repeat protein